MARDRRGKAGAAVALVVLLFLAPSCGAFRFHHAWSSFEPVEAATGMEGRWRGEWRSEWNGHSGGLRCVMTRNDAGDYRAWFYSTYASLLFFQHQTIFRVTAREADVLRFEGEEDLGEMIGGVYRYEGSVERDSFRATFRAGNGDHGVMEMRRVE